MNILNRYLVSVKDKPFRTQSLTITFLCASGDLICQYIMHKASKKQDLQSKSSFDYKRTLSQAFIGFAISPWMIWNHNFAIPRLFPNHIPYRVLKSNIYTYSIVGPVNALLYFALVSYSLHGYLKKDFIKSNFFESMYVGVAVWLPFSTFNFKYVPAHYRTLTGNTFAMFWQVFLSYLSYDKAKNKNTELT
mmetsp:Transcript_41723/g.43715  ORF Transcript_41723/g.43715 Transcript_41723/m.43715 type:complete len:191 (+) Transcript_41723:2-574(+)